MVYMFLVFLSETSNLQILGYSEEGGEVGLGDVDLAVVEELQDGLQVGVVHSLEVEQRVGVGVLAQDSSEEWRTGGQN